MTTYGVDIRTGLPRNARVPFTGFTGILGDLPNSSGSSVPTATTSGAVYFNGQTPKDHALAKMMRGKGPIALAMNQAIINLLGVAVGTVTTGTTNNYKRVVATDGSNAGGLRPIEDVGLASRNTTTQERDAYRGMLLRNVFPSTFNFQSANLVRQGTYPVDLSGNGGGGKVAR
jgi:hypothetical protein